MKCCVNVDWVELYCKFDSLLYRGQFGSPHASDLHGFGVVLRPYGTRVYKCVSCISYHGIPFAVLCYHPLSSQDSGGIMNPLMCHLKLENYWCYNDSWYEVLHHALRVFRIKPVRLSRADICLDVQHFRNGIYAADLCRGLIERKYYKIHQSRWNAHGEDSDKMSWHSLGFGSKQSSVFTRFYNKSLELRQVKDKQYIREIWQLYSFNMERDVWRIEFSLTDTGTQIAVPKTHYVYDIPLEDLASRERLMLRFLQYAQHYWDIRKNTGKNRYRCERLDLLPDSVLPFFPYQRPRLGAMNRTDRMIVERMLTTAATLPNRGERMTMFESLKLYQSSHRVEVFDERQLDAISIWLYNLETDDMNDERQLRIFEQIPAQLRERPLFVDY